MQNVRDYKKIGDGTISIDSSSSRALKLKEMCENTNIHPAEAIITIYGSFEEMYRSGDLRIDFKKHFSLKD